MKMTAPALALVALMALGIPSLFAANTAPATVFALPSAHATAPRLGVSTFTNDKLARNPNIPRVAGDLGWRPPSLTTPAHAAPSEIPAEGDQGTPLSIGAWFIGLGFLAFVISRKRFNK
jgi:hypothetical protein